MKRRALCCLLVVYLSLGSSITYPQNANIIRHEIDAPSLENNLINEPTIQPIFICLPPNYDLTADEYPVVYYLSGFGMRADHMVNGRYYNTKMGEIYDSLMTNHILNDFILVIVSGRNLFAGSFYVNSPVTGNWEDFVVEDVIKFVDEKYRTIKSLAARGLTGHSMGGFGSLYIGLRHPDLFGSIYAMSPAVFGEDGLNKEGMFSDEDWIKSFIDRHDNLNKLSREVALDSLFSELERKKSFDLYFEYAYGTTFAPDTSHPPYVKYPYKLVNNELVVDSSLIVFYKNGAGNFKQKIQDYLNNGSRLEEIIIEYGNEDEFRWIPDGCDYLSKLFNDFQIKSELRTFEGTHGNRIRERLIESVFPYFNKIFSN